MSPSNWRTEVFNTKGEPCGDSIENGLGSVEFYKNWLYVKSPKMWVSNLHGYPHPIIAEVSYGKVSVAGFWVHSFRYEEDASLFAAVGTRAFGRPKFIAGIGHFSCGGPPLPDTSSAFLHWFKTEDFLLCEEESKKWLSRVSASLNL